MHLIVSVCLSVLFCQNRLTYDLDIWYCHQSDECQCVYKQGAFANILADAVDRLLILYTFTYLKYLFVLLRATHVQEHNKYVFKLSFLAAEFPAYILYH